MTDRIVSQGRTNGQGAAPAREPIFLDRNENRYGPAPACRDFLRDHAPDLLFNYPRTFQQGHYSLLAQRLSEVHGVDEDRIILGYGAEDILKCVVHRYVAAGETILIPSASWWYYHAVANEVGGVTREYPLIEGRTSYRYDIEAMLDLRDTVDVKLLLVASPNNPTGNSIAPADLRRVLDHYRGIPTVLDQAYFGLTDDRSDEAGALVREFPDLIVLRSFSKLYALAGVRIGYGIAGGRHEGLIRFCTRNLGYHRLSEALALIALDSPDYYDGIRRAMAADRDLLYARLRAIEGVRVYESNANFVLARFPEAVIPALDRHLKQQGFIIKFFKEPGFLDCARITLGTSAENLRLVTLMEEALPSLLATVS